MVNFRWFFYLPMKTLIYGSQSRWWGATCFTHHICQELLSTSKKPYLSQKRSHWNTQFPLSTINCGGMEKWVNHETYRLLTREAQPDRSCNPLSSDDIRPIIPMPGQVDLRSPFRCSEVFIRISLKVLVWGEESATAESSSGWVSWWTRTSNNHWMRSVRQTVWRAGRKQQDI